MRKPEFRLQCQIVQYLRHSGIFCFAVPNGGSRHPLEAVNLKRSGAMAGVADLVMLLPSGHCIFVEIKANDGKQSPAQKEFQAKCEEMDFYYLIWRSLKEAENFVFLLNNNYKVGGTI